MFICVSVVLVNKINTIKQQPKKHMSRRLKSPSSSYIFERFSLQTCAS